MIWSISWKNVWRSRTRSLIVVVAVTLGLFSGVFGGAVMVGWVKQRIHAAINNEISHIQIHNPEYFANKEIQYVIKNVDDVVKAAKKNPHVKAVTARTKVFAMAHTSGTSGTGIMLYGIDPENEKAVTKIYDDIQDNGGSYFETKSKKVPPILISEKTAKKLKIVRYKFTDDSYNFLRENNFSEKEIVKLKSLNGVLFRKESEFLKAVSDTLNKTLSKTEKFLLPRSALKYKLRSKIIVNFQGFEGNLVQSAFRVTGVYKTENGMFDEMAVFVLKKDLDELAGLNPDYAHEIAILCDDTENVDPVVDHIKSQFKELNVMPWSEIQPDLKLFSDYLGLYFYILTLFILLALGFGIVNTMLMAILERIKELGMLMAIGMNKMRVFSMIMLESVFLTLTGGVLGIIISALVIYILSQVGLDLRAFYGEGLEAIGYSALVYPEITADYLIGTTILVVITGILASIYPARKAIKLNPAEAVRTDN